MPRAIFFLLVLVHLIGTVQVLARATPDSDHDHDHGHGSNDSHSGNNTNKPPGKYRASWEPYVYGSISVGIVSLLSLAGVIIIPFIKNKLAYDSVMLTFMALAVGCMTSDALLHLVPETLGLEEEEAEDDGHQHEEEKQRVTPYLGKMVAILATLYGLYLLELIMHTGAKLMKKTKIGQTLAIDGAVVKAGEKEAGGVEAKWASGNGHGHGHGHSHGGNVSSEEEGNTILGLKSYVFVIVLSDAMHNFTDGLAIGAAFSKSSAAGMGVSIAVVCHELPHEIGNFAILLNSGMSFKKAMLLNFLSAVTSFAGLYPGIVAGQQEALARWIFAAVCAGFLYVALVHMLRELQSYPSLPWWLSFILQNMGMLVGFTVIFLLAIYEHELSSLT